MQKLLIELEGLAKSTEALSVNFPTRLAVKIRKDVDYLDPTIKIRELKRLKDQLTSGEEISIDELSRAEEEAVAAAKEYLSYISGIMISVQSCKEATYRILTAFESLYNTAEYFINHAEWCMYSTESTLTNSAKCTIKNSGHSAPLNK